MELQTKRLVLKELASADMNDIHALHSCPEVDQYNTLGIPGTIQQTASLLSEWIGNQNTDPRISYIFCVRIAATDQFIGLIALNLGKPKYRRGEVWYKTLPSCWGQGYTTEALTQVLKFGFAELQLHRIEAGCATENAASIRVLEKVGMTREGRHRKILPIRGEWVDNFSYAILEGEFNIPTS